MTSITAAERVFLSRVSAVNVDRHGTAHFTEITTAILAHGQAPCFSLGLLTKNNLLLSTRGEFYHTLKGTVKGNSKCEKNKNAVAKILINFSKLIYRHKVVPSLGCAMPFSPRSHQVLHGEHSLV